MLLQKAYLHWENHSDRS